MNRFFLFIFCVIANTIMLYAQYPPKALSNNEDLTKIFVNPLGIQNAISTSNPDSLIIHIERMGLDYKTIDLGKYGRVISISPTDFHIGNTPISRLMIIIQKDMNGIIFQSAKDDNYKDMSTYLNRLLPNYAVSSQNMQSYTTYMLDNTVGIVVGEFEKEKTSMAILMDMKNLQGFLSLQQINP